MEGLTEEQKRLVRRRRRELFNVFPLLVIPYFLPVLMRPLDLQKVILFFGSWVLAVLGVVANYRWWYSKRWTPALPEIVERMDRDELLELVGFEGNVPARYFERLVEFPSPEKPRPDFQRLNLIRAVDGAMGKGVISPELARKVVEWHEVNQVPTSEMRSWWKSFGIER